MADVNTEPTTETDPQAHTMSRRKMLGSLAVGTVVVGVPGVVAAQEGRRGRRGQRGGPGRGRGGPPNDGGQQLLPQLLQRRPKQLARHSSLASSKVRSHLMRSTTN